MLRAWCMYICVVVHVFLRKERRSLCLIREPENVRARRAPEVIQENACYGLLRKQGRGGRKLHVGVSCMWLSLAQD